MGWKKNIYIEFTNVRTPSFRLIKIDGETKEGIADISFNLYKDGQFIKSVEPTKFDGSVIVTDLETGFYQVQEISAPSGYLKDDFKYEIYIDADNPVNEVPALTIANYKRPSFRIQKIDAVTGKPIPETIFKVSFQGQEPFNVTTGEDGTVTLDNLNLGTYSVREEWVSEGYILDKETVKTVEITKDTTEVITLTFKNLPQKDILINKIDAESKKPLQGIEFEIFRNNKSLGTKITDENGKILIEKTEPGEYRIVEIKTLDNYILNDKPLEFTHSPKNQSTDIYEYTLENYEKCDIMIIKTDKNTGWKLAGAEFTVVSQDGKYNEKFTTDENGEILIKNLDNNTYVITETKAPNGYELPTDINEIRRTVVLNKESQPIVKFQFSDSPKSGLLIRKLDSVTKQPIPNVTFTVEKMKNDSYEAPKTYITNENGVIIIEDIEQAWYRIIEIATVDGYVLNPEPQMIHVTNTHESVEVIAYNNQKNMLNILKIDSVTGKPLIGAMFDISTAGGKHIANIKTGVNGYATLPNLEPGSYVVKEIEAPDGHIIDPTPQTFEIEKGDSGKTITLIFKNDNKINLYIKKIDGQTNFPLADAEFKLTKSNGEIIAENVKTGEDGLFLINNLLPGTYIISETKAPQGYILDSTPKTVHLKANQTKVVEFLNNKPGGVIIRKVDAVTGVGLEGAEFEIYTVDDKYIGKYITDKDGYIHIENLRPGFYFVKETKAPDGYTINIEKQKVEVKEFEPTNITIENNQKSLLTIRKIDSETKLPLAGAKFQITNMDGKIISTVESNSNGVATINKLTAGYYIIKEIISPEGYILNEAPQTIQIQENIPAELIFPNTQIKGLIIKKVDSVTKEPLAGAVFEIRSMDNKLIGEYITDNSGIIISDQLKPGFYKVIEKKPPDGYLSDSKEQIIEIIEGNVITVTFTNSKKTSILIYKIDSITKKPLAGAKFEISKLDGTIIGYYDTDSIGKVYTEHLNPGQYVIKEIKAPNGYTISEESKVVTVKTDEPVIVTFENNQDSSVLIVKKDSKTGELLANAVFVITDIKGNVIGNYTIDETGTAITGALSPGTYMIRETYAPDGYLIDNVCKQSFEVNVGKQTILNYTDTKKSAIQIIKVDSKTGEPLEGAKFEIKDSSGNVIGIYTTDDTGVIITDNLNPGTYIIRETHAPNGYSIIDEEKFVNLEKNKAVIVTIENNPDSIINLKKTDSVTSEPLAGAEFTLSDSTGKVLGRYTTDSTGCLTTQPLKPGIYTLTEIHAPNGYVLDSESKTITVVSGEQSYISFTNSKKSVIEITKVDSITKEAFSKC